MKVNQFYKAELEADVLGTMISYSESVDSAMMILDVNCFWSTKNKTVFSLIAKMWNENKVIDLTTILTELGSEVETVGISYITEIVTSSIGVAGIKEKCKILVEVKKRFQAFKLYEKMGKMFDEEKKLENILDTVSNGIDKISFNNEEETGDVNELMNERKKAVVERKAKGGYITGISTGYFKLDIITNGLKKSELVVLAGRPAMGKSTLANNIALNVATYGKKVSVFNLEMSKEQIADKLLSNISMVDFEKIAKGKVTDEEIKKMSHSTERMTSHFKNIRVYESFKTLESIIAYCRIMSKKSGLDVVVIDYLQLIRTSYKSNSREQEIAYITRSLKELTKELKINIIALSQLSRAVEQRVDKRPQLSDLRESGSIEQDILRKIA